MSYQKYISLEPFKGIQHSGEETINLIIDQLEKAESKHPNWSSDLFVQIAVLGEEFGEFSQAVLQHSHENGKYECIEKELLHVIAVSIRILKNLPPKEL